MHDEPDPIRLVDDELKRANRLLRQNSFASMLKHGRAKSVRIVWTDLGCYDATYRRSGHTIRVHPKLRD